MNTTLPNNFDCGIARELCRASADAYCESEINNGESDTHVLVQRNGSDAVVAFRGTADARNWLTDLKCGLWRDALCGKIHEGFHLALESVWEELDAEVRGLGAKRVWVTGHSLGGALAMLFAWYWEGPIAGVYTFGQPRVGNGRFCDNYNLIRGRRTFRVVHADDIVPRVPWLLGAYRHAGHEVFYPGPRMGDICELPYLLDPSAPAKLPLDFRNGLRELTCEKIAWLADHHVDTYLELFQSKPSSVYQS
jgi:pimeloyl-ACP methyl ester carboxylesterase